MPRLGHALRGTALSAVALAALTASQAPGLGPAPGHGSGPAGHERRDYPAEWGVRPGDGSYHTELPPLRARNGERGGSSAGGASDGPAAGRAGDQAGIPVSVLAAYRRAARSLAGTDPGCRLRWELLAAIGKVESGQARGGAVDADGTTRRPILGPVLNGGAFAHISDTDRGVWDGDTRYDRAVGPMQFIPSTWARWGADGNGDGRADPNNIHDAALAAGRYLCAGDRDLSRGPHLHRAVLSYNQSRQYLRTVLSWYAYYRKGAHPVRDGDGVLPASPGAGNAKRPAARPADPERAAGGGPRTGDRTGGGDNGRSPGGGSRTPGGGGPG
ncbi:lytic transglycosylase domain-containing protein, partial [Streptomyces boncukensis]|uniref:lytic transglycosylase domain-containing protein n=1 Tax=Streptomyces boncukensis TaxID=2711219 RepID=UPI003B978B3D